MWQGYWDQLGYGRQLMHRLRLHFVDGRITGGGRDLIGEFVFAGTYDAHGQVRLTKHYLGKHTVDYQGEYDGEGTLFGRWNIGDQWHGTFALTPVRPKLDVDRPIVDL
jgi:hypothetical protein